MSNQEDYLRVREIAEKLKIHRQRVYELIQEGKLEAVNLKIKMLRVPLSSFVKYKRSCQLHTN